MNKNLKKIWDSFVMIMAYRLSRVIAVLFVMLVSALLGSQVDSDFVSKVLNNAICSCKENKQEPIPLNELFSIDQDTDVAE